MKKLSILLIVLMLALTLAGCKDKDYENAMELYIAGEYELAGDLFTELGDYKDSAKMLLKSRYALAEKCFAEEAYEEAIRRFEELGDYEDSAEMVLKIQYAIAEKCFAEEAYEEAIHRFEELGDYEDSAGKAQECRYQYGRALMGRGAFAEAREILVQLGDYLDSKEVLEHMGWHAFHAHIAKEGKVVIQNAETGYTVTLTADQDAICAEYIYDKAYTYVELTARIGKDPTAVSVSAVSQTEVPNDYGIAYINDEASGIWDITGYKSGDTLEWNSYYCPGMILHGVKVSSPFPINGQVKYPKSILTNLTASLAQALEDSTIGISMADIGFSGYEG